MIRPATCLCMLLAAGSGLYLYQTKHQGLVLDHDIARIAQATDETRARIGVLRAEFALLNDPSRLQELAAAHLPQLAPLQPGQFTTMADLDARLPPVGAASAPDAAPDAGAAPLVAVPALAPVLAAVTAPAATLPIASTPAHTGMGQTAAAAPAPTATPAAAVAAWTAPAPAPAPVLVPATVAADVARPPPPRPRHPKPAAPALVARREPVAADPLLTQASAPGLVSPAASAAPTRLAAAPIGSALGMARLLGHGSGGAAWLPTGTAQ